MKELRRVQTGPFREEDGVTLHDLFDVWENYKDDPNNSEIRSIIKPVETSISHLPFVVVNDNAIDSICHGSDLMIPGILAHSIFTQNDMIAILSSKGELIGLGISYIESKSLDNSKTGRAIHPTRVIMKRGTYPRYQKNI
jgi:H/ACA ribonucleoprotein complex subunit 4